MPQGSSAARLEEKGAAGLPAFLMRKTARTFGAGNGEIYYSLSRGPLQPGHAVYSYILEDGPHFGLFNNAAQCVYLSFYILGHCRCAGVRAQTRDAACCVCAVGCAGGVLLVHAAVGVQPPPAGEPVAALLGSGCCGAGCPGQLRCTAAAEGPSCAECTKLSGKIFRAGTKRRKMKKTIIFKKALAKCRGFWYDN